jgi:hypothetical protein
MFVDELDGAQPRQLRRRSVIARRRIVGEPVLHARVDENLDVFRLSRTIYRDCELTEHGLLLSFTNIAPANALDVAMRWRRAAEL